MLDLVEAHAPLWEKMHQLLVKNRLPQALLFVGPRHARILQFVNRLIAIMICENRALSKLDCSEGKPCGHCRACHLLKQGIHPDINYICQEGKSGAIKVEQIRELQQDIYQTPQRGVHRFIVIEPAHKMNISAANALLKILEEPPSHTMFILIAEQLNSIPPTVLSRCQKYNFYTQEDGPVDYLSLGSYYPEADPRTELFQQNLDAIITELCDVIEEKTSPCQIAEKWSAYGFDDLLWLLYLVTAQAINYQLIAPKAKSNENISLMRLTCLTSPINLLKQLEQINAITRKINHNINMNQMLVLEELLLSYLEANKSLMHSF